MTDQELIWICFEPVVFPYPKILYGSSDPNGDKDVFVPYVPAARIEELVKERDDLGRKLNTARYGQPDFAWSIHEEAMADLRAKLTKAVEALRNILKGDYNWSMAREVLAELEGK